MKLYRISLATLSALIGLSLAYISNHADFLHAIYGGDVEAFVGGFDKRLLQRHGAEFLEEAASGGNIAIARLLLENGVLPHSRHQRGVLDAAVSSGNRDLVAMLVELGADPTGLAAGTVADVAIKGDTEMCAYLQEHGYDFSDGSDILDSAVMSGSLEMVKFIVDAKPRLNTADYLNVCQKALQMAREDISDAILSAVGVALMALLELSVAKGNYFMVKQVTAFLGRNGFSVDGSNWQGLALKAYHGNRLDIAEVMLDHLDLVNLGNFLSRSVSETGNTKAFFAMIGKLQLLGEAIKKNPGLAKGLITSAMACNRDGIIGTVLENASLTGLSYCCKAIRSENHVAAMVQLLDLDTAQDVLLYDIAETAACFAAFHPVSPYIRETILRLLDGTAGSAKVLSMAYYAKDAEQVKTILTYSPRIKYALGLSPSSAGELYHLAVERGDVDMEHLSYAGLLPDAVLKHLGEIWTLDSSSRFASCDKTAETVAFLAEVKDDAVVGAYNLEAESSIPDTHIQRFLKARMSLIRAHHQAEDEEVSLI